MSSEPNKPMEQMLEALAKARRAEFGGDPKMPNPMRVRLHEEIARVEAAEEENVDSRPSWVTRFWPRLTVAAALATLLVLVPAIWWNRSHPVAGSADLALRDGVGGAAAGFKSALPAEDTLAKAPALSATEASVNLADNDQIKIEPAATPPFEAGALTSTQVAQGRAASASASQMTKGFDEIASAKTQSAPAIAPAPRGDSKSESDKIAAAAPPVAQSSGPGNVAMTRQFPQQSAVQSFRNNAQVSRAANVLNTFQVQQQGNEIRVLDADGSTYTGKIEQSAKNGELGSRMAARREAPKRARTYSAIPSDETASAAPQSYFRATGYNVSLKKTVVFEGNYAPPATQQPATAASKHREQAEQTSDRARIVGTVRVNGEAPVTVDATSDIAEPAATKKSEK